LLPEITPVLDVVRYFTWQNIIPKGAADTMIFQWAGAFLVATALLVSQARAHGGVSLEQDTCKLRIGPDEMHFTGYQPLRSREEFCEDIPYTGVTVIALDAVQNELRDMATEIRIIRDVGPDAGRSGDLDRITEAYLAPRKYPAGTVTFEHVFAKPGRYIGLVIVEDSGGHKWISRFPFSVGETAEKTLSYLAALGLTIACAAVSWFYVNRKRRQKSGSGAVPYRPCETVHRDGGT
jgi:hypothetical protein